MSSVHNIHSAVYTRREGQATEGDGDTGHHASKGDGALCLRRFRFLIESRGKTSDVVSATFYWLSKARARTKRDVMMNRGKYDTEFAVIELGSNFIPAVPERK